MSLSANFPHQLALLVVALQTDKLPICEHLDDPTEKSLIATLMTYMNNREFRTPITIARKTLGNQIRVKRSTLFAKLKNLKEKGLIEESLGEKPIRFTEKAISLMQLVWTKQVDKKEKPEKDKKKFFRLGNSTFPAELTQLINRGLTEKQIRGLMIEAKQAKVQLQKVLLHFEDVLAKYDGKVLFLVIRDILRKPEKYIKSAYSKDTSAKPVQKLSRAATSVLGVALNNDNCILLPGEKLTHTGSEWLFSSPSVNSGAPVPVTEEVAYMLQQRMSVVVKESIQENGPVDMTVMNQHLQATGEVLPSGAPKLINAAGGVLCSSWETIYAALPYSARLYKGGRLPQQDSRKGKHFLVNSVRYYVEAILDGVATLRVENGKSAGCFMSVTVDKLDAPEVCWQAD